MGILTQPQILKRMKNKEIKFSPSLDKFQIRAHSIDLRLGFTFMTNKKWKVTDKGRVRVKINPLDKTFDQFDVVELEQGQFFEILPNEYVIVSTLEKITMPDDVMAVLYPRSSINRQGLSVDLSGIVDAGYSGNLIIPIRNNNAYQYVRVYPGERFCQIVFHDLNGPVDQIESRYHNKDVIIGRLPEKYPEETEMIRNGEITRLKKDFKINIKKEI